MLNISKNKSKMSKTGPTCLAISWIDFNPNFLFSVKGIIFLREGEKGVTKSETMSHFSFVSLYWKVIFNFGLNLYFTQIQGLGSFVGQTMSNLSVHMQSWMSKLCAKNIIGLLAYTMYTLPKTHRRTILRNIADNTVKKTISTNHRTPGTRCKTTSHVSHRNKKSMSKITTPVNLRLKHTTRE